MYQVWVLMGVGLLWDIGGGQLLLLYRTWFIADSQMVEAKTTSIIVICHRCMECICSTVEGFAIWLTYT